MRAAFTASLCLLLPACATLDARQCRTADWRQIGVIDGRMGHPASHAQAHREACTKEGVTVADEPYMQGHTLGLAEYCTPRGGFYAGSNGYPYRNVCAKEIEMEFLKQYEAGKRVWELKAERDRAREDIKKQREAIDQDRSVAGDISKAYHLLAGTSPTADKERRVQGLSDEIQEQESLGPVGGTVSLHPQPDVASVFSSLAGAGIGLTVGFGAGHAVQGHYRTDGWKWTAIDAGLLSALIISSHNCSDGTGTRTRTSKSGYGCDLAVPVSLVGFIVSRIWQGVALVKYASRDLNPYRDANGRFSPRPLAVATAPANGAVDLRAIWTW